MKKIKKILTYIIFILIFYICFTYFICFTKINHSKFKKKQVFNKSLYRWSIYDDKKKCVLGLGTISKQIIKEYQHISIVHHDEIKKLIDFDVLFLTHKVRGIEEKDAIKFIKDILSNLGNSKKQIINFCSEAEFIYLPYRIKYGNIKKKINKILMDSNHIVYNIYLPYEKFINIPDFLSNFDSNYIYHYPSILSQYVRPCYLNTLLCNDRIVSKKKIQDEYGILLFYPLFIKSWKLYFKGPKKSGRSHYDRQRCSGTTFRVLNTIYNTSDYTININNEDIKPTENEFIIINNRIKHKPKNMNYGERKLEVYDFNTSFDTFFGSYAVAITLLLKRLFYNF